MSLYFVKHEDFIECTLCPHMCKIRPGKTGICRVRKNTGDQIGLQTYGVISGYALDPIEKKPLYHFFPGYNILSVGSFGCNMRCDFCQNWHISQRAADSFPDITEPGKLVSNALMADNNIGIAFTYNEPVIWFEYLRDTAIKTKEKGMFTVMVSNGYVNRDPLTEITTFIDAFNIDLKAFSEDFYRRLTGAGLVPVKESLKQIAAAGKHLEVTTLIIPGRNDDPVEMESEARWIAGELGSGTPLHLSRYHPTYKREDPPTSQASLDRLYEIASKYLKNVYLGNAHSPAGQETRCPDCGTVVTERSGYRTRLMNLDPDGNCTKCGSSVYRYFNFPSEAGR